MLDTIRRLLGLRAQSNVAHYLVRECNLDGTQRDIAIPDYDAASAVYRSSKADMVALHVVRRGVDVVIAFR